MIWARQVEMDPADVCSWKVGISQINYFGRRVRRSDNAQQPAEVHQAREQHDREAVPPEK
jgi:hypothetical protein